MTPIDRSSSRRPSANRRALLLQVAAGVYLMGMFGRLAWRSWSGPGGGGYRKSALYGIWDIARMSVDGEWRSPLLNDYDRRWRRVIFDAPDRIVFQRTDDSFAHYGASIDTGRQSVAVTKGGSRNWQATFTYRRSTPDRLTLQRRNGRPRDPDGPAVRGFGHVPSDQRRVPLDQAAGPVRRMTSATVRLQGGQLPEPQTGRTLQRHETMVVSGFSRTAIFDTPSSPFPRFP